MANIMNRLLGPHYTPKGKTDNWITPRWLLDSLGDFDLDPCCPESMPWSTAKIMYHHPYQDGLTLPWHGRVWLNPPYGKDIGLWLDKLANHGNGIALTFVRTDTKWCQSAMRQANALFFLGKRVAFYTPEGIKCSSAGAPSMLLAYGYRNITALRACHLPGLFKF